jgi:hypothetical protein
MRTRAIPGPYPVGPDTHVEHGSDRHALVIERDACILYEIFNFDWNSGDSQGGSGAVCNLGSNAPRPRTWTSADAAGSNRSSAAPRTSAGPTG